MSAWLDADKAFFASIGAASVPFEAQRLAAADPEKAEDAFLLAARFEAASPPRDLWRHEETGAAPLRRHEALDLARRIAREEPSLRGYVRWVDGQSEALVRGRGWAWRFREATGETEYRAPGGAEWVNLRLAALACRAEVLAEERARAEAAKAAGPSGPVLVRDGYDQREGEGDDGAQPPAPDDECDSVHAAGVAPYAEGGE